jgi:hypothetical protein
MILFITKNVGIVRLKSNSKGETKTDADGNVNTSELEIYNPIKFTHQKDAKASASTTKEIDSRGLYNPFSIDESTNKMAKGGITEHGLKVGDEIMGYTKKVNELHVINRKNNDAWHSVDLDDGKRYAKGGMIEMPNSNLFILGFKMDTNGNKVAKVSFPNKSAFSIQTLGNLPYSHKNFNSKTKVNELTENDLKMIEKEVVEYIKENGNASQKSSLKVYSKFEKGGKTSSTGWKHKMK